MRNRRSTYADPGAATPCRCPAAGEVEPQGGGVSLLKGPAYASLLTAAAAARPRGMVEALAQRVAPQWQRFSGTSSGEAQFGGKPGAYAWFTGVDPRGTESVLKIAATVDGETGYAMFDVGAAQRVRDLQERAGADRGGLSRVFRATPMICAAPSPGRRRRAGAGGLGRLLHARLAAQSGRGGGDGGPCAARSHMARTRRPALLAHKKEKAPQAHEARAPQAHAQDEGGKQAQEEAALTAGTS